jgi:hypothetical protein
VIAHISGVPVEELAPFAASGATLVVARLCLAVLLRRGATR